MKNNRTYTDNLVVAFAVAGMTVLTAELLALFLSGASGTIETNPSALCNNTGNYIFDLGNGLCHTRFNGDGANDLRSF